MTTIMLDLKSPKNINNIAITKIIPSIKTLTTVLIAHSPVHFDHNMEQFLILLEAFRYH